MALTRARATRASAYARGRLTDAGTRAGRRIEALKRFRALGNLLPKPFTDSDDPGRVLIAPRDGMTGPDRAGAEGLTGPGPASRPV